MKYLLLIVSFFTLGCQMIDPVVVPIHKTFRDINSSSTLYENNSTHTKLGFQQEGLVWKKEF